MNKRMSIQISLIWLIIVFIAFNDLSWASEAKSGLSLNDILSIAYEHNPKMEEARKEIEATQGRQMQAGALPNTEVEFSIGGLKAQKEIAADGAEKTTRKGNLDSFVINQPFDPAYFLKKGIAGDELKIASGELNVVWGNVRKDVIAFYGEILAAEKSKEIATANINAVRQFFVSVQNKFESGNALKSDVIRANIEVSRAENEFLVIDKNLKTAKAKLNLALGQSLDTPLTLSDSLTYEGLQYLYENVQREALSKRADLLNETTRLNMAIKNVQKSTLKSFLPEMAIGVERTTTDYENDTSILLGFTYPFWGFNQGEVKEAKAEREKQKIRLEGLKREVGLEAYQAFLDAELADKQVLLQQKTIDEANELLRQISLQYESGKILFLTYLENIKTIKETRLAYLTALKDYKEKIAELERAIQATPIPEGERK